MIAIIKRAIAPFAITLAATCAPAMAAPSAVGVWIDHTGRGAVEISDCGGRLCGKLVWFQDPKNNKDGCNFQIIGDVKPVGTNKWDGGWIVDPEKDPDKKYDVEITLISEQKLKVMGYAGIKFLSETMIWTRAKPDLKKCGKTASSAPESAPGTPETAPPPEQEKEASVTTPPPETTPAPEKADSPKENKTAANSKKKDCKVDLSFAVITFPCPD
jgi:uncharacterized protein (DUF2147 family)